MAWFFVSDRSIRHHIGFSILSHVSPEDLALLVLLVVGLADLSPPLADLVAQEFEEPLGLGADLIVQVGCLILEDEHVFALLGDSGLELFVLLGAVGLGLTVELCLFQFGSLEEGFGEGVSLGDDFSQGSDVLLFESQERHDFVVQHVKIEGDVFVVFFVDFVQQGVVLLQVSDFVALDSFVELASLDFDLVHQFFQ